MKTNWEYIAAYKEEVAALTQQRLEELEAERLLLFAEAVANSARKAAHTITLQQPTAIRAHIAAPMLATA